MEPTYEDLSMAMKDLQHSDGWPYMRDYILQEIESCKSHLLSCEMERIMVYRGRAEAFTMLLGYVEESIAKGE